MFIDTERLHAYRRGFDIGYDDSSRHESRLLMKMYVLLEAGRCRPEVGLYWRFVFEIIIETVLKIETV